ncbi:MAG: Xaa-Pro peptidase family protein, partial [Ignavibacteria bacterium]|nr:Xaa-Pro peptidase family protein [Ignavibacteria bacterium]
MKRETIINRRNELLKENVKGSVTVLFSGDLVKRSADSHYPFEVNRNFYYLTNCDEDSLIYVYINTENSSKEILFIKDYNPLEEKWVGKSLTKDEAIHQSGVFIVYPLSQFESIFTRTLARNHVDTIYVDSERDSFKQRINEAEKFTRQLNETYPHLNVINLNPKINSLRTIKNEEEIELMKQAIEVTRVGIEFVLKNLSAKRFEYQSAADFAYQCALHNSELAFDTIVASGKDATVLHYVTNQKELSENDLVLFDLGASVHHYCADISRTFPVSGQFTERQKVFYNIALKAQEEVIKAVKPGVTLIQLNEIVRAVYKDECVKANIIENAEQVDQVYYHSVSHSLGLD